MEERLVVIPGSLNEHRLAHDLVAQGNVTRAVVVYHDHVSFDAWRVSDASYAWRTPMMPAPAFGVITPDTRPSVEGMPRWEWDLYGYRFDGSIHETPHEKRRREARERVNLMYDTDADPVVGDWVADQ